LAISAWIPERSVIPHEYRATSLLATMRERWNLGAPFSARESSARSFNNIFTLSSPRPQDDWPEITPRPVPVMHESIAPLDAPLGLLDKSFLFGILTLAKDLDKPLPKDLPDPHATITGAQALALGHEIPRDLFPNVRDKATLS
jgi:phospholipase C